MELNINNLNNTYKNSAEWNFDYSNLTTNQVKVFQSDIIELTKTIDDIWQEASVSKTQLLEDFLNSGTSDISIFSLKKFMEWKRSGKQDVQKWISHLDPVTTFPSIIADLSKEEACCMLVQYRHTIQKHRAPTEGEISVLENLEKKIDKNIEELKFKNSTHCVDNYAVFTRLSTRSPKDAVYSKGTTNHEQLLQILKNSLNNKNIDKESQLNQDWILLRSAATEALKTYNGKETLHLLLNSERVYMDLTESLSYPNLWDMKLVLRKFVPLNYGREFRGFVYNKRLTAISQYDSTLYFPELKNKSKKILKQINDFFQTRVKNNVFSNNYIIDFAVKDFVDKKTKSHDDKTYVIEINPFDKLTSGGLFSWDKDLEVLQGFSSTSPVFRYVKNLKNRDTIYFPEGLKIIKDIKLSIKG